MWQFGLAACKTGSLNSKGVLTDMSKKVKKAKKKPRKLGPPSAAHRRALSLAIKKSWAKRKRPRAKK